MLTKYTQNHPGALISSHPGQDLRCSVYALEAVPGSYCVELYTDDNGETRTVGTYVMDSSQLAAFRDALTVKPGSDSVATDTLQHYAHKQVLVLRKDLNMRKGKMVAQGAHAAQMAVYPRPTDEDIERGWMTVKLNEHNGPWLKDNFKKVVCSVQSEQELMDIYHKAVAANIPCSLVTDSGLTEFAGVSTITAVAVGPAHEDVVNPLTGHLSLL